MADRPTHPGGAGGALLTYAWHSFPWRSLDYTGLPLDLASNAVFTAGAIAVLVAAARRVRQPDNLTPIR